MTEIARREDAGELAERTPQEQMLARIRQDNFMEQIRHALPPTVTPEKFVRVAATALMEKPDIALAEPTSILTSLLRCAQLGLLPDGHEAAINVYRTKAKDPASGRDVWIEKAQLLPMIHGYAKIAANYGWALTARVVFAADEFEYEQGLEQKLRHVPARPGVARGDRIAVYAIARKRGHDPVIRVLDPSDVQRARDSAKTQNVWNMHTDRMWEKTAGKLLVKNDLPKGDLDERVLRLIEAAETDPADAAAATYGPQARAALTAGETVDHETGEITSTDTPRDGAEDVAGASIDDAGHRTPGGTTGAVSGGDAEQDGGGGMEAAAAGSSGHSDDVSVAAQGDGATSGAEAAAHDRHEAAAPDLSGAAASTDDDQDPFHDGSAEDTDVDVDGIPFGDDDPALAEAAAAVFPRGKEPPRGPKGLTLAQVLEHEKGATWLQLALGQDADFWGDPDFALKLGMFVRANRPELLTDQAA